MDFLILVDTGDKDNINMLRSQIEKNDILLTEKLGGYPSRMIHRALIYNKSKTNTKVIMIKPGSRVTSGLLYYLRTITPGYGPLIIDNSYEFDPLTYQFTVSPIINLKKNDIVHFDKSLYHGKLADMSGHLDYNNIIKILLGPVKDRVLVGSISPLFIKKTIPTFYYNMPESFIDLPIDKDVIIKIRETPLSEDELRMEKPWNCYATSSIYGGPHIPFDVRFEKICVSFENEVIV